MREELVLHGWDITGDDTPAQTRLSQWWMSLGLGVDERVESRLRVAGTDDVVVAADAESTSIRLDSAEGPATLETDAAARVLLLWGRRPADPARICSAVGPVALGRLRTLLSGY
jgi:hypothetical protein